MINVLKAKTIVRWALNLKSMAAIWLFIKQVNADFLVLFKASLSLLIFCVAYVIIFQTHSRESEMWCCYIVQLLCYTQTLPTASDKLDKHAKTAAANWWSYECERMNIWNKPWIFRVTLFREGIWLIPLFSRFNSNNVIEQRDSFRLKIYY